MKKIKMIGLDLDAAALLRHGLEGHKIPVIVRLGGPLAVDRLAVIFCFISVPGVAVCLHRALTHRQIVVKSANPSVRLAKVQVAIVFKETDSRYVVPVVTFIDVVPVRL